MAAIVLAAGVAVVETTIAAIHGNRANRAGSFFECTKFSAQAATCLSVTNNRGTREYVCQEVDQHLQSAKKNTHGNRDKGTRKSAGINESSRSPWKAVSMRWLN